MSSTISSNAAVGGRNTSTSLFLIGPGGNSFGGGVAAFSGSVSILNSVLDQNLSSSEAGGGNTTASYGGALYLTNSTGFISDSMLRANFAAGGGSGPGPRESTADPTAAFGGAVANRSGHLEIVRSDLIANSAIGGGASRRSGAPASGGALYSDGPVSIRFSTISLNRSFGGGGRFGGGDGSGGGWYNTSPSFATESLFSENTAAGGTATNGQLPQPAGHGFGGSIANSSELSVTNCTFAVNVAQPGSSVAFPRPQLGNSFGGAVYNVGSFVAVNATFASNATSFTESNFTTGGSFFGANIANTNGTVTLRSTIVAYPNGTNSNVHGPITDGGHNMSSDGSANFNSGTSFNFTDPRLDPLSDNGGPTLTMALRPNSPAIDFGDSNNAPSIDQRGFARPAGNGVDIGAYEFNAGDSPRLNITFDEGSVQISFSTSPNRTYEIQSSNLVDDWTTIETVPGSSGTITRRYSTSGSARFYRLLSR